MRFFEFSGKHVPYYALIGADDQDSAIEYYCEVVCEPDDDDEKETWISSWGAWGMIKELTQEETIETMNSWENSNIEDVTAYFNKETKENPCLLGIDSSLI